MANDDLPKIEPRWWLSLSAGSAWSGVFQGGGARGAAYAGALAALEGRGEWFEAVTGSSAGALTATLVAAGYHPSELRALTEYLLASIRPDGPVNAGLSLTRFTRPLVRYDGLELEARLELLLRNGIGRHGGDRDGPVTFRALVDAVQIPLYVVALDTTTGAPIVFCAERTPHLAVAPSVLASCAIPLAFEPRYLYVDETKSLGASPFHRVVDGGAYANLPHLVFTDAAVRQALELEPRSSRPLVFTLSDPRSITAPMHWVADPYRAMSRASAMWTAMLRPRSDSVSEKCVCEQSDDSKVYKSERIRHRPLGRVFAAAVNLGFTAVFGALTLALVVAIVIAVAGSFLYGAQAIREGDSVLLGVVAIAAGIAGGLGVIGVGRMLTAVRRVGMPTLRAVLGLATGAPFWVGLSSEVPVLFVSAPGLATTDFRPRSDVLDCVIGLARQDVNTQLDHLAEHGEPAFSTNLRGYMMQWEKAMAAGERPLGTLLPHHHHGRNPPPPPITSA